MENITDVDYKHVKKVLKMLQIENIGYYHELYVQSNTLLLADVFETYQNKCVEICELDPAIFLSAPGLAWQYWWKKTEKRVKLLIDIDMLLMVEKRIIGVYHTVRKHATANNKYIK